MVDYTNYVKWFENRFVSSELVQWNFALFFFGIAFAGAFIGKTVIDRIIKKYKMSAILVLILGAVIALSTIMIGKFTNL